VIFNKIKYFLLSIDALISKAFFYSQAQFSLCLRDSIYSLILGLSRPPLLKGNDTTPPPLIEESKLAMRSVYQKNTFTTSYEINLLPEIVNSIILSNMSQIRGYLGKHFCLEKVIIFRNYNFQEEFSGYDVYSNVWHQDSFDGNRLLKIFVLLDEVSDNDGPFHYLNLKNTKVHWEKLKERWSFKKFGGVEEISDQETFTGKIGDYLIMGTSRLMHRASIPLKSRDMLQITLLPKWKKHYSNDFNKYL
jgi:hypothetical protein